MKTRQIVTLALITALNVAVARIFLIPVAFTHGNINLCDAGIVFAGIIFGVRSGALVGGLSGFLLDLFSGYPQYMLFSLMIHGLQGTLIGTAQTKSLKEQILVCGGAIGVLVGGYFIADSLLYGWSAGILGIATNLFQGTVGTGLGLILAQRSPKIRA